MICSPSWLTVPTRMFLLLLMVCSFWMCYMWISVSAALFGDWPHGYSPGQSIFAELGCSFRTALSCCLGWFQSQTQFSAFFSVPLFFARIGQNQRAWTTPRLNLCGRASPEGCFSTVNQQQDFSYKISSYSSHKCTFGPGSSCAQQSWREWLSF